MNTHFIDEKAKSKFNLNFITSPLMGIVLLTIGEIAGLIFLMPLTLSFLLPLDPFSTLVLNLFNFAFIALAVILWARFVEKSPLMGLGFTRKHAFRDFLIGWGLGGAMLTLCVLIMMVLGVVTISDFQFSSEQFLQFFILILAWSVQGTTEEILTRGWMLPSIANKNNIPVAILVSSLFFTAIHIGNNGISILPLIDLLLFAILACLLMLKTGNIWVISGWHAAWNCFQGNVFNFPVSGTETGQGFIQVYTQGPEWLSGGQFGVEGSIVSVLVQLLIICWLTYDLYFKHKQLRKTDAY